MLFLSVASELQSTFFFFISIILTTKGPIVVQQGISSSTRYVSRDYAHIPSMPKTRIPFRSGMYHWFFIIIVDVNILDLIDLALFALVPLSTRPLFFIQTGCIALPPLIITLLNDDRDVLRESVWEETMLSGHSSAQPSY